MAIHTAKGTGTSRLRSVVSCFDASKLIMLMIDSAGYYLTICFFLLITGVIWGLSDIMKNSKYVLNHLAEAIKREQLLKSHIVNL